MSVLFSQRFSQIHVTMYFAVLVLNLEVSPWELLYNFLDAYRLGYSFDFRELYSNEPEHETKSKPLNQPLTKF